jgi:hypothetical protein
VVAYEADEGGAVAQLLHEPLVCLAAGERRGGGRRAGRVLRGLDQEAVTVLDARELVDQSGVRRAPPGALVLGVASGRGGAGMQAEVLAHRLTADPGAQ